MAVFWPKGLAISRANCRLAAALAVLYFLRLADFFARFLADAAGFLAGDFFLPPKIPSQPSAYFLVVPTRMMLMEPPNGCMGLTRQRSVRWNLFPSQ